jgi:hypothetical protein
MLDPARFLARCLAMAETLILMNFSVIEAIH